MRKKSDGAWFKEPQEPSAEQVDCPKCCAAMTKEAVLCMQCGYNQTSGKYVELPQRPAAISKKKKRSLFARLGTLFAVFISLLFFAGYVFYEPILEANRETLPDVLKEKLPERLSRPINPEWLRKMTKDALSAVYESEISNELTRSHPPYAVGDTVTLRSESGKSGRGIFQGVEAQDALLEAGGKTVRVPFISLNLDCRLRADRAGRQLYIYETASRRADAFLKN